ncbi:hypothetical protein ACFX13_027482 [Malus domestica]
MGDPLGSYRLSSQKQNRKDVVRAQNGQYHAKKESSSEYDRDLSWDHSSLFRRAVYPSSRSSSQLHHSAAMGKVHGSLARAGKVRGQTPKVAKQDKKKKPRGRAHKRLQYNRRFVTAVVGFGKKRGPNSSEK